MVNPPVPLRLRILRGNPGKRPLRPEPKPAVTECCPEPPSFLSKYAVDEWWRVAPHLHRLGLLTVVDTMPLACYCESYSRWRTAEEALARVADRDEHMRGLVIKSADGNARRNPLVKIASDASADMLRAASEFGLSPVARSRIAAGVGSQPLGKFDGLLSDGQGSEHSSCSL